VPRKYLNLKTIRHLSYRLGIPPEELKDISSKAGSLYFIRYKSKKNGDKRKIFAPNPSLKRVQKAVQRLLREISVSDSAHGGIRGRSNASNAKVHCSGKWIYQLDFKNFFPNISHHMVYGLFFHELKCSPKVASLLTKICTAEGQVPAGGVMSTDIANLICRKTDRRIEGLASAFHIHYTRYVDDVTFSGKQIPDFFKQEVKKIIRQGGFILHPEKENLCGSHQPQIVTGLSVNGSRPKIPRKIRRELRKEEYIFRKFEAGELSKDEKEKYEQRFDGKKCYFNYIDTYTDLSRS